MVLEESMMYQEKETKYDGYAKKLFYDWRNKRKIRLPVWEKLDYKDRDEWRGVAQLMKRERKEIKKLFKNTGDKHERQTTRSR
jgi:hypothetical protein